MENEILPNNNLTITPEPSRIIGKVIIIGSVILIAVVVALTAIFFWRRYTKVASIDSQIINEQQLLKAEKVWKDNLNQLASVDKDFDNLTDVEEKQSGTDPTSPDTDKDGLLDGDEVQIHKTDPLKADTDGDGIVDGRELRDGTDPLKK